MPKILVCANSFPPSLGGIATYASQLAHCLSKLNFDVTVLAPALAGHKAFDAKAEYRIVRYSSKLCLYISWLLKSFNMDMIFIVQRGNYLTLAYYLNKLMTKPYVVAAHGHELTTKKLRAIVKKLNGSSAVIPVSSYTAKHFLSIGVDPSLINMINNGSALIQENNLEIREKYKLQNKLIILTVARLIKHKGQDKLIQALPAILKEIPNTHYLIAGDGPDKGYLETLVAQENLTNHVTFTGAISNEELASCYYACDLFAMISRQHNGSIEGFGIAFLEAGSAGKAVIGGNSGGIPDAVEHNVTGVLVDPENIDAISMVVTELLKQEKKRTRLGLNGKQRVMNEFTWEKVANKYATLFERILKA